MKGAYPYLGACELDPRGLSRDGHLVALFRGQVPVGVREVDVAARLLHHLLDLEASFANDVRVVGVGHVHFQSHAVLLKNINNAISSRAYSKQCIQLPKLRPSARRHHKRQHFHLKCTSKVQAILGDCLEINGLF